MSKALKFSYSKDWLTLLSQLYFTHLLAKQINVNVMASSTVAKGKRSTVFQLYSQFHNEDDLGLVLEHVMQSDNVGMFNLLQDANLTVDGLSGHTSAAGLVAPLPDELGCILYSCAFLQTFPDHCKLATADQ